MAIPRIVQGDDTAANGRSLVLQLPDAQIGGGYEVVFDLCGLERSGQYVPGGTLAMDFTAEIYGGVSTVAKFKLTMNMKTGKWKVEPAY